MKKFLFPIITLILISCTNGDKPFVDIQTKKYILRSEIKDVNNQNIHTSSLTPLDQVGDENWLTYINDLEGFLIAYPADYPADKKHSMKDLSINQLKNTSCTPTIMGTNTIQNYAHETGGNTVFGIVTGKGYPYEMHTFDDSLCMPPYHPNDEGNYENNHVYDGVGAYVLCSQKEEKTVLICISQMTDNPKLAEEIFSTFRWIK